MSQGNYEGISIREAMEHINARNNGWFLPSIQRQYVWGSRDSSEEYICLLLDSLVRGYPIGGLVLWETDTPVPFREFLGDYNVGSVARLVAKERWGHHKFLVYDGQQRLQTLFSVLYHKFNGRTLYFNLLFDGSMAETDETGFFFKNSNEVPPAGSISMIELMGKSTSSEKIELRRRLANGVNLSDDDLKLIEINLDSLWSVFVATGVKSIAYFPVKSDTPKIVNEVFRRLNTGGVQLTQLEMVLAKIKEESPFFEEFLWDVAKAIQNATGTPGYNFSAHDIVQLIYLLVFQTVRIDESKMESNTIAKFVKVFDDVKDVLPVVFEYVFFESFHINSTSLILRQQAVLPILAYFVTLKTKGFAWEPVKRDLRPIFKYFIKSQLCDWNTQTMVTAFARKAIEAASTNQGFPLDDITRIAVEKNRTGDVFKYQLEGPVWFSLKILTPERLYLFNERKPQIDHIFPKALKAGTSEDETFRQKVDVIWNMQPTPAGLNNYKRAKHPVDFFKSAEGRPFLCTYNYLPDLDSDEFQDVEKFIAFRRERMIEFMKKAYDIEVKENPM